ncbi:hypothetical protein E3N88_31344 [Mikania micrantha]|uniref:RNA polymerase II-associated protein 1 C-terminal domain-containing protein n=1 Tax=Mikania micrantha TaxID=192012 RepID=A0A5N6MPC5_9ASTR|nr:hypothetical protein E3N88_31344 [Mikania micrantha]
MEKSNRNGDNSSSGRKTTTFGVQLSENDVASSVMGGIVEKGFNQPVSQPQPTVLPFPVARHRSHGPHWAPRTSNVRTHGKDDEEDDGEDEDFTNFDMIAADAKPIKRKQNKGLNFRRWQELMNDDNKKEHKSDGNAKPHDVKKELNNIKSEVVKIHEHKLVSVGVDDIQSNVGNGIQSTVKSKSKNTTSHLLHAGAGNEQDYTSMESEIDAENRARLEKMSTDEIAEAQAEIMKKMNPELIKILQKRGQKKMKKTSSINSAAIGSIGESLNEKIKKESTNDNAHNMNTTSTNHMQNGLEDRDVSGVKSSATSLWDAWSTNVEAARDLRFSLDGDVIDDYGPGNSSAMGIYSVENASERDFLRTEGDPGALGYTIKEALSLTRSVVPGQRALALHLLASVLYKAQDNIIKNQTGSTLKAGNQNNSVDWEALWAFALGPEPELALSLRMCLDDNHNSVVIACARVIQCVLSYDFNEHLFDISDKTGIFEKDICTAPIFRSRANIDVGFLHGGFWKYNTKPSNIFPFDKVIEDDDAEDEHTIKDDLVVATQDIAAGLVRMGILPRIRYLLESDPSAALEECLISILVAIARHSPTCADAIMKCERLVQVVVHRFTTKDQIGVDFSKIKSVILVKVLARSDRKRCMEFVNSGIFQKLMWHLYHCAFSLDHWMNIETEKFKLLSALLVEQLRLWKVCITYGHCVSCFSELFPALYFWLDIPTYEKLIGKNIIKESTAITKESYLVLKALSTTLPNFYPHSQKVDPSTDDPINDTETWRWSHVGPMIDLALKWLSLETDPYLSSLLLLSGRTENEEMTLSSILWVISAVLHFLSGVLKRVIPEDKTILSGNLPWLPEFIPKIGLHIIKNRILSFDKNIVITVDKLIMLAKTELTSSLIDHQNLEHADKILTDGILRCSISEMTTLLTTFMKLTSSSGQLVQSIEMFGRGGPAPGVGVGWGASGGGFWSLNILVAQMDARLVLQLLEIFLIKSAKEKENDTDEKVNMTMERINCAFALCLLVGPKDEFMMEKVLDILLHPQILMCLDIGIHRSSTFGWHYTEEEYVMFSENLISHFKNRWVHVKKSKSKDKPRNGQHETSKKSKFSLKTIQEDIDTLTHTSLVSEWAHQRLPLPAHWFLSPISTIDHTKLANLPVKPNILEVSKSGLFFILGLEAISKHVSSKSYSIQSVPIIWKLHALSVTLFAGMDILEDEKARDIYGNLQKFYGQILDEKLLEVGWSNRVDFLKFDKEIHDSYSTFVETLVENFAGASYGDLLFGRQISIYLHRCVGAPVRLAVWNALSNIRALELLPPLEKCLAREEGYLEPLEVRKVLLLLFVVEFRVAKQVGWTWITGPNGLRFRGNLLDDEMILEAYVKSWVSGSLDRSLTRKSVAFTLVVHHLSYFIFGNHSGDRNSLRNKLTKSILRDYSRKADHEGMMIKLIQYVKPANFKNLEQAEDRSLQGLEIARRLTVLTEACEGNSTLLNIVEKLKKVVLNDK